MRFAPMVRTTVIVASALVHAVSTAQAQTPIAGAAPTTPPAVEEALSETLAALDRLRAEPAPRLSEPLPTTRTETAVTSGPSDDLADRALSALAAQQDADANRILQLQEAALARSNARIRAVQAVD
ncbi:MAG: hypothetical protein BGN86_15050 [Caulobacterales bacterium 68-7]|nr:MAG: hypothetical protein BGN86_15050 [Caulobacterales bacterium 68-7]